MRIKLTFSYDGTAYSGWQVQPGKDTVQQRLISAVKALTAEDTCVVASGRTDAGVHALAQIAHVDIVKKLSPERIKGGLNNYLPCDIRIASAEEVSSDFHARKSAKKKTYVYRMYLGCGGEALYKNRAFGLSERTDLEKMSEAAEKFLGAHDFSAFRSAHGSAKTTVRTVYRSEIIKRENEVYFVVSADGFLYNMVRIMARFILNCGEGKSRSCDADTLFKTGDRSMIKGMAPACGLYLYSVEY